MASEQKPPIDQFETGSYRVNPPKNARGVADLIREHGIRIVELK